jgi:MOSC domain-containing protein YiiM
MTAPRLVAVCVGKPELRGTAASDAQPQRPWSSAIWKAPVAGPVRVHGTGVDGDAQADTRVHGGPEKAVLAYAVAHYAAWAAELDPQALGPGAFGENFAFEGLDEASVAIGDVVAIGSARLQVCQPRSPCWKLARKFGRPELVERVLETGRTGWYLRVLAEGVVAAGDEVAIVERPHPRLLLTRLHEVLYAKSFDLATAAAFASCPALSDGVRQRIANKLA